MIIAIKAYKIAAIFESVSAKPIYEPIPGKLISPVTVGIVSLAVIANHAADWETIIFQSKPGIK